MPSTTPTTDQMAAPYRGMDKAQIDAGYNNSAAVADSAIRVENWTRRSEAVRAQPTARLDLRYGPKENNRIDFFPTTLGNSPAPLFVFVHGGYWFRNSKEVFAHVSEGPCANGINVATVGYTLAPEASLSEITQEVSDAISFLAASADELGFDPNAIIVGGWSAGGQLATISADHPNVAAILSISGIFDLTPIRQSYIDDALSLTFEEIETLSPLFNLPNKNLPLRLYVGGGELPELKRQSSAYTAAAVEHGLSAALDVLGRHNHFTIIDELSDKEGLITLGLVRLVRDITAARAA